MKSKRDIEACERAIRAQRLRLDGHTLTIERSTEWRRSERCHYAECSCGRWEVDSSKLWDVRRMFRIHLRRVIEDFNLRTFAERVAGRFRRVQLVLMPVCAGLDLSGGDAIIHWEHNVTVDGGRGMMPFPAIPEGSTEEVLRRLRAPDSHWGFNREYGWEHVVVVSPLEMQSGVPEQRAYFGVLGDCKEPDRARKDKDALRVVDHVRHALERAGVVVGDFLFH